MPQVRVFVDTNVILEAIRSRRRTAITTRFAVEIVKKCVEEKLTGDLRLPLKSGVLGSCRKFRQGVKE